MSAARRPAAERNPGSVADFLLAFERSRAPFGAFLASFAAFVAIRQLLEMLSTRSPILMPLFLHYAAWYAATASALIALVRLVTGEKTAAVARSVLACYALILVAPIADLIIAGGKAVPMRYLAGNTRQLLVSFLTFMGGPGGSRATPGLRIESGIILIVAGAYLAVKTRSIPRTVGGTAAIYATLFLFTPMPQWTALFFRGFAVLTGVWAAPGEESIGWLLFLVAVIFTVVNLRTAAPSRFRAIVRDLRPLRILHYVVLFVLGYVLYRSTNRQYMALDHRVLYFVVVPLCLTGAALHAIVTNNLEDLAIDRISNPDRPHVRGDIPRTTYRAIGAWALAFSLATAAAVGYWCLLLVGITAGCYFLYSATPFRLKRVPILSKLLIGTSSLAAAVLGFTAFGGNPLAFPAGYAFYFLVPFTLAANVLDLKDEAGDRSAGIRTLPVIVGGGAARIIIAISILGCYLCLYLILGRRLLAIPMAALCAVHVFTVVRRRYQEHWVLAAYLIGMIALVTVLAAQLP
jgi:4-hydroxybenzoate polyprenyltransferase